MQVGKESNFPFLFRYPCDQDKSSQLVNPLALPSLIWSMHQQFERSAQHVHLAYSSFCGAHGALSSLAFQQIFAGESRRRISRKVSECHFAPVIRFGTFVETGIIYDKTSGDWPNWNTLLADNPVLCPPGEALTGFKLESGSNKYMFECSRIGGLGIQYEYFSAQVEVTKFDHVRNNWLGAVRMLKVDCGENALLSGFHFEFSEGGRWARSKYTCSKAGGAPVVMEPSTTIESRFHSAEGIFCPKFRDMTTGRYRYENTAASGETLTFQEDGRWCIGNSCSKKIGGENPIGAILEQFEVANVTDFDGEFEAKGVPDMSAGSGGLAAQLKLLKPPKRPAQPPKPKLQDFKAEQPKYSEECLDYEDLWKKVIETTKGEDDEPVTEEAKLEPDEGTVDEELVDYHPCAVAASAGGVFGKIAGQSGKLAPENMLYSDWNDCMQGDINRDLYVAHWDFAGALHGIFTDLVEKIAGMVCSLPPDLEIAPLGAGIQVQPGKHCDKFSMLATFLGEFPYDFMEAANSYAVENEGFMACNPFQAGLGVRDAVIRGDRTIIRNLEKATKISNDNMKKMVEWSTEANRVETEYLDKKIDHSLKVTTLHLQTILAHVEPKEQLLSVASSTEAMLQEMQGLAQAASFGPRKRLAGSALNRFLDSAQLLESTGNLTNKAQRAGEFQAQVVSLYQSLQSSGDGVSKAEVVAKQVAREVEKLQHDLHKQQQVLGVYRHQSHKAKEDAKSWKSSEAAVTLDHLWWKIRNKLDQHLDEAEEEVARYRVTFKHLKEYEGCKTGLKDLFGSYAKSMKRMRKNHHKLHSLWRETSNLRFGTSGSLGKWRNQNAAKADENFVDVWGFHLFFFF
ncbi:unnamed protein product [Cladocopium goreaui]|uniref:Uncharacterized protein n=1 Tax=Cladocopium goreaui TaxID=2562237 RepID=A0A9P1GAD7_9DINO|nr:unnamed protein product [Cladocopium goreaui]